MHAGIARSLAVAGILLGAGCKSNAVVGKSSAAATATTAVTGANGSADAAVSAGTASSASTTGDAATGTGSAGDGAAPGSGVAAAAGTGSAPSTANEGVPAPAVPDQIGAGPTLASTASTNIILELASEHRNGTGYRQWRSPARFPYVQGLKIYGRIYLNPLLDASLKAHDASHPVGSIAVLEAYKDADAKQFAGWYVLAKGSDAADPAGWFTYQLTGTPPQGAAVSGALPVFPGSPQADSLADKACVACHSSSAYPGFIIGTGD